ncbi:hypothetical protein DXB04_23180 [Enterocloster bolteae]|uniref:Uncharacterized protein n=1 Tax=Enterocloster bolteae TaxID=208479 RepID=A0A414AP52_9FIRM|nr:hypothetical protein DXB04_23180 [Enterocloster bolteae]RHC51879.1 hypothetical protein DW839_23455 [Enterocloster bolteae]
MNSPWRCHKYFYIPNCYVIHVLILLFFIIYIPVLCNLRPYSISS